MTTRDWNSVTANREITRLIQPGILGFYSHFEATEVVAFQPGESEPINVFTILVAEERQSAASDGPPFLNPDRIRFSSLKGWKFGIRRYVKPIAGLLPAIELLHTTKTWQASGQILRVPADLFLSLRNSFRPTPPTTYLSNRVLKNNFRNGSHVFEWVDPIKAALRPLFDDPPVLQELSEVVQAHVPIGLASLSDRLGNIIVQLPVTVLMAKFGEMRESGESITEVAWHPKSMPRALRVTCEADYDGSITAFDSRPFEDPRTLLPMADGEGLRCATLWDEANGLLLATSGQLGFIKSLQFALQVITPEPRVFSFPDGEGGEQKFRVAVMPNPVKNTVGDASPSPITEWRQFRMYREETTQVQADRRFVQYLPLNGQQREMHEKAIEDLRFLIRRHGEEGVWLWDPYLGAIDVIETLFHSSRYGADLRALSAGCPTPSDGSALDDQGSISPDWAKQQRAIFDSVQSNWYGLRLEFRVRIGTSGWPFHDRFLVFPATDRGAQAWSLGTSLNGLGKQHHILQKVDDGQRIRDAFEQLWRQLDQPEHLVWRKP
jgi:hypothetical protein